MQCRRFRAIWWNSAGYFDTTDHPTWIAKWHITGYISHYHILSWSSTSGSVYVSAVMDNTNTFSEVTTFLFLLILRCSRRDRSQKKFVTSNLNLFGVRYLLVYATSWPDLKLKNTIVHMSLIMSFYSIEESVRGYFPPFYNWRVSSRAFSDNTGIPLGLL